MTPTSSASLTRKWLATQITATAGLLTAWTTAGGWNSTLTVALISLVGQAAVGYLVPNQSTPGGAGIRTAAGDADQRLTPAVISASAGRGR